MGDAGESRLLARGAHCDWPSLLPDQPRGRQADEHNGRLCLHSCLSETLRSEQNLVFGMFMRRLKANVGCKASPSSETCLKSGAFLKAHLLAIDDGLRRQYAAVDSALRCAGRRSTLHRSIILVATAFSRRISNAQQKKAQENSRAISRKHQDADIARIKTPEAPYIYCGCAGVLRATGEVLEFLLAPAIPCEPEFFLGMWRRQIRQAVRPRGPILTRTLLVAGYHLPRTSRVAFGQSFLVVKESVMAVWHVDDKIVTRSLQRGKKSAAMADASALQGSYATSLCAEEHRTWMLKCTFDDRSWQTWVCFVR